MSQGYLNFAFDAHSRAVIDAYDELPLWSAAFGQLLFKHLPLHPAAKALDLGTGAGFPAIELAGRLGPSAEVWAVDTWAEALERGERKARVAGLTNLHFRACDASALPFDDGTFNLIVSNLGVNNFSDVPATLRECRRVLKTDGCLALTTNLRGHMAEFYAVFGEVLKMLSIDAQALAAHIAHRTTVADTELLLRAAGLRVQRVFEEMLTMRFANGSALLNHYFIKLGFLEGWKSVVPHAEHQRVFALLESKLNDAADKTGALVLSVPTAYIEAKIA